MRQANSSKLSGPVTITRIQKKYQFMKRKLDFLVWNKKYQKIYLAYEHFENPIRELIFKNVTLKKPFKFSGHIKDMKLRNNQEQMIVLKSENKSSEAISCLILGIMPALILKEIKLPLKPFYSFVFANKENDILLLNVKDKELHELNIENQELKNLGVTGVKSDENYSQLMRSNFRILYVILKNDLPGSFRLKRGFKLNIFSKNLSELEEYYYTVAENSNLMFSCGSFYYTTLENKRESVSMLKVSDTRTQKIIWSKSLFDKIKIIKSKNNLIFAGTFERFLYIFKTKSPFLAIFCQKIYFIFFTRIFLTDSFFGINCHMDHSVVLFKYSVSETAKKESIKQEKIQ